MNNTDNPGTFSSITSGISKYVSLLVEDTKLNVAEKLTRLLSAVALCSLLTIIVTVALVFISIAVGLALSHAFSPLWAFFCVAAFYVVLLAVLIIFRRSLLVNPIARFISVLLLDPPQEKTAKDAQSTSVS